MTMVTYICVCRERNKNDFFLTLCGKCCLQVKAEKMRKVVPLTGFLGALMVRMPSFDRAVVTKSMSASGGSVNSLLKVFHEEELPSSVI